MKVESEIKLPWPIVFFLVLQCCLVQHVQHTSDFLVGIHGHNTLAASSERRREEESLSLHTHTCMHACTHMLTRTTCTMVYRFRREFSQYLNQCSVHLFCGALKEPATGSGEQGITYNKADTHTITSLPPPTHTGEPLYKDNLNQATCLARTRLTVQERWGNLCTIAQLEAK